MTRDEFARQLRQTRINPASRAGRAAFAVLVMGKTQRAAAKTEGITPGAVSQAVGRLTARHRCPHCNGTGRIVP